MGTLKNSQWAIGIIAGVASFIAWYMYQDGGVVGIAGGVFLGLEVGWIIGAPKEWAKTHREVVAFFISPKLWRGIIATIFVLAVYPLPFVVIGWVMYHADPWATMWLMEWPGNILLKQFDPMCFKLFGWLFSSTLSVLGTQSAAYRLVNNHGRMGLTESMYHENHPLRKTAGYGMIAVPALILAGYLSSIIAVTLMNLTVVVAGVAVTWIAIHVLYGFLRSCVHTPLLPITVGVLTGGFGGIWYVDFSTDFVLFLPAFGMGSLIGFTAGEIVRRYSGRLAKLIRPITFFNPPEAAK
jgi:hypothetical protein